MLSHLESCLSQATTEPGDGKGFLGLARCKCSVSPPSINKDSVFDACARYGLLEARLYEASYPKAVVPLSLVGKVAGDGFVFLPVHSTFKSSPFQTPSE